MKEHFTVFEQRKMNQHSLDTFTHGKENVLDYPVDNLIRELKTKVQDANNEHNKWIKLEETNPEEFRKFEEKANQIGESLHSQMFGYIQDIMYLEDELFALFEMKIIYAFKHL
jgi:molecular chaperone DnaK (HSP70)